MTAYLIQYHGNAQTTGGPAVGGEAGPSAPLKQRGNAIAHSHTWQI